MGLFSGRLIIGRVINRNFTVTSQAVSDSPDSKVLFYSYGQAQKTDHPQTFWAADISKRRNPKFRDPVPRLFFFSLSPARVSLITS